MKVDIRGHDMRVSDKLGELVDRHLRFALSRFGRVVRNVSVRLADENGPRGGVDKHCRMVANLGRLGEVVIEERDTEAEAAVARASDRLGRAVRRAVDRRNTNRRRAGFDGERPVSN